MNKNNLTVIDRRGQVREEKASPEPPAPAAPPVRVPVTVHCGRCEADLSSVCSFTQVMLPHPAMDGSVGFAPQTLFIKPLVCPFCGESQVYQQKVMAAKAP